jgi:excisionase family DNA binding protein
MTHEPRPLMTVSELAEHWAVSRDTVDRMIRAGAIPVVRVGSRCVRVNPYDVERVDHGTRGAPTSA